MVRRIDWEARRAGITRRTMEKIAALEAKEADEKEASKKKKGGKKAGADKNQEVDKINEADMMNEADKNKEAEEKTDADKKTDAAKKKKADKKRKTNNKKAAEKKAEADKNKEGEGKPEAEKKAQGELDPARVFAMLRGEASKTVIHLPIEKVNAGDASGGASSSVQPPLARDMSKTAPTTPKGKKPNPFRKEELEVVPDKSSLPHKSNASPGKKDKKDAIKKKEGARRASDAGAGFEKTRKEKMKELLSEKLGIEMKPPKTAVGSLDPAEVRKDRPHGVDDGYMRPFLPAPSLYDHPAFAAHDAIEQRPDHHDKVNTLLGLVGNLAIVDESPDHAAAREYERAEDEVVVPEHSRALDSKLGMGGVGVMPKVVRGAVPTPTTKGAAEPSGVVESGRRASSTGTDGKAPHYTVAKESFSKLGMLPGIAGLAPGAISDLEHRGYSSSAGFEVAEDVCPPLLPGPDTARRKAIRRIMAAAMGKRLAADEAVAMPPPK